jgi:hypothetical protein
MKTPTDPQGLPPHSLPAPSTWSMVGAYPIKAYTDMAVKAYAEAYALEALAAQAATIEAICKIIECAGPEAADEIADLLGYPSVEWPSDQAASAPPSPASVPADASAPIWNSIQIASWIGSQLMHEPAMFERAVVCKFVRSLGRHPTLLKHSPHPQAVAEGAGDGLRQTLIDVGRMIAWRCFGDCRAYDEFGPGSLRGLHVIDAEIRAALATKEPK